MSADISLADRAALIDLAYRYAQAVDSLDGEKLLSVFTEDGSVGSPHSDVPAFKGQNELRQMLLQVKNSFHRTMHQVFNQTFEKISDTQVRAETYCLASHIIVGEDGNWKVWDMSIIYDSDVVKKDGAWKYRARRLDVRWMETRAVEKFDLKILSKDPSKLI